MKNPVVIGGSTGVGKSAVCRELLSRLDKAVWLDGDWCWMIHPWQVTNETQAMVERNIISVLRLSLYQALDVPCLDTTCLMVSQVADRVQEMIRPGSKHSKASSSATAGVHRFCEDLRGTDT
jgi:cytidylate kinase